MYYRRTNPRSIKIRIDRGEQVDSLLIVKREIVLKSCDLRGSHGWDWVGNRCGVDLGAVEKLVVFEHTEDGVQEFTHNGDQGDHFEFSFGSQVLIESAQLGLAANGHQGGHIEGAAQMSVAGLADAALLVDRSPRGALARIESGVGDPLAYVHAGGQEREFGQDVDGAGDGDAANGKQQFKAARQLGIIQDELLGGAREAFDGALLSLDAALHITPDDGGKRVAQSSCCSNSAVCNPARY